MLDDEDQALAAELAKYALPLDGRGADDGVGEELREARRRLGWELPGIAAAFRIPQSHLEALEEGNLSALPAGSAEPLLRTYAAALGLDSAGLAYRFTGDTAEGEDDCPEDDDDTDAAAEPPDVAPAPTFRWGAAALVGLILAAGAGAGWYALPRPGEPPGEAAPATKLLPAPAIPEASRSAPAGAPSLPDPDEAVAASAAPAQDAQPAEAAPALPVALIAPASVPAAQTPAPENTAPAADPPSAPPSGGEEWRLVLRAKADTWLQVRSRSGQVLLSRTLHEGEVWPVPPEPDLVLSTGNAGGTELVVDGVTAPSIGNPGAVRRNLPLDPDLIRDGKLPAQQKAAASAQPPGEQPASP